jgi:IclR family mhp operon transcriptional activator
MDIARAVELPYPTTIRIVQTLMHEGMLESEPVRKLYRVTSLVRSLAVGVHEQANLIKASRPQLTALTYKHGWPVSIAAACGPNMMVHDSTFSMTSRAFNNYYPGFTFPMLDCAAGQVHLAYVDDETRECLLSGMDAKGHNKVVQEMFRAGTLTRRIRDAGYATHERTLSSLNPGKTSSIALPILDRGYVAGVLSMTYFYSAMPTAEAERRYLDDLRQSVQDIGQALESMASGEAGAPPASASPWLQGSAQPLAA